MILISAARVAFLAFAFWRRRDQLYIIVRLIISAIFVHSLLTAESSFNISNGSDYSLIQSAISTNIFSMNSIMTHIPLLVKDEFESFRVLTQINSSGDSPVNHALTHVAQEVAELLQHAYPVPVDSSNHARTIKIRAIEPEYRQIITAEPLTERELEVLQLIVDGCSNDAIAQELYISAGTVKTHVRNILKKLCASGRTQAAIRALRAGLAY